MKITTETTDQFVAVEKSYTNLLLGPLFIILAVLIFIFNKQINQPTLVYVVGGVFVVVGIVTILFRKVVTLAMDKASKTVNITMKRLIGGSNKSVPFSDVNRVEVVTAIVRNMTNDNNSGLSFGNTNSSGVKQVAHLIMYFNDGTTIDLSDKQKSLINSFSFSNKIPNTDLGQRIAAFIGVPFAQEGQATGQQMIGGVIDAIKNAGDEPNEPKI